MSKEFSIGDYVDLEFDERWRVARVVNKETHFYSVILDGYQLKNPLVSLLNFEFFFLIPFKNANNFIRNIIWRLIV